jgi:anti-sigma factor (TIGR02949 family)
MDCQHAMTHLFPYLDGEYELADRPAFEQHLSVCPECAARYRFERAIKSRLREAAEVPAPVTLRERIAALVH